MMEKFIACLRIIRRNCDRDVSLAVMAFLIGGLMAPALSAYAAEIDATIAEFQ